MRHTKILAALTTLSVLTPSLNAVAQTVVNIPRITFDKAPTTATPRSATFGYVSTPTLSKQVLESYLAKVRSKNPARAKMLAADFSRTNYDAFHAGLISRTGLNNYDTADALTAYMLTGYIIANNIKTMPPRSHILAARRQTAAILAKNPAMANAATRGRAAEEFKLLTVTLHFGLISARRSGDTKAYADSIASLFAETGPNPRTLRLTNAGFIRKS